MTTEVQSRSQQLRAWMKERDVTDSFLARHIGITPQAINRMLKRESMPTGRYKVFVELGFPVELLPRPLDRHPGPRPKVPQLPCTMQTA